MESKTLQGDTILTGKIRHCGRIVCTIIDAFNTLDNNYFEEEPITRSLRLPHNLITVISQTDPFLV